MRNREHGTWMAGRRDGRWRKVRLACAAVAVAGWVCMAHADVGAPLNTGNFKYQMKITFSGYAGTTSLTNFPALVALHTGISGFNYAQLQTGAADLRFADSSGFELAYDKDTWNESGTSYVWVRLSKLAAATDYIRAYWGNASATAPAYTTNGVAWPSYAAVWHMREPAVVDSSALHNTGIANGNLSSTGLVGTAQSFASTNWVNVSSVSADITASAFTLSGCMLTSNDGGIDGSTPISASTSAKAGILWLKIGGSAAPVVSAGQLALITGASTLAINSGESVTNGVWRHFAYVRSGSVGTLYIDGVQKGTYTAAETYAATDLWSIGQRYGGVARTPGRYFIGKLDEMRIASTARSVDWVKTESSTARNNAGFTTYGAVEFAPETGSTFFGW